MIKKTAKSKFSIKEEIKLLRSQLDYLTNNSLVLLDRLIKEKQVISAQGKENEKQINARLEKSDRAYLAIENLGMRLANMTEMLQHPTYAVQLRDKNGKLFPMPILACAQFAGNILLTVGKIS